MESLADALMGPELSLTAAALRLLASLIAGGLVGLERERRRQPAGLRTHILISTGSTLLMLLSIHIPRQFAGAVGGDPGRIAAQVVSGIGFLGAGAILKMGNNVKGLTTAASIWVSAGLGLALGAGLFFPAVMALAIILFTLFVLNLIERRLFPPERVKLLSLSFDSSQVDSKRIRKLLYGYGIAIQSFDVVQSIKEKRVRANLRIRLPLELGMGPFYKDLRELPDINKIKMDE